METSTRLKLFLLLNLVVYSVQELLHREFYGNVMHDQFVYGYKIQTIRARDIFECAQKCLSLPLCSSFNFKLSGRRKHFCRLHGRALGREGQEMYHVSGFLFVQQRFVQGEH